MTCKNGTLSLRHVLPPCLVIVAFVIVAYNVFNMLPDHVIKIHATGRLGTISSVPQNLVHI